MSGFRKTLLLFGFVLLATAALIVVVKLDFSKPIQEEQVAITSLAILERISDQYFVVTKSVYVDQKSEIVVDTGSKWSNFFWGQTVKADGVIRVDVGVDMSQLTEKDIVVDQEAKTVRVDVPPADILNASQYGDIEVESQQGVQTEVRADAPVAHGEEGVDAESQAGHELQHVHQIDKLDAAEDGVEDRIRRMERVADSSPDGPAVAQAQSSADTQGDAVARHARGSRWSAQPADVEAQSGLVLVGPRGARTRHDERQQSRQGEREAGTAGATRHGHGIPCARGAGFCPVPFPT